jgi:hypothetical protein
MSPHAVRVIVKPTTKHSCTAWYPVYFYIQNNSTGHQVTGFTLLSDSRPRHRALRPSWASFSILELGCDPAMIPGHPGNDSPGIADQIPHRSLALSCESLASSRARKPTASLGPHRHTRTSSLSFAYFDVKGTETNGLPCHFCHFEHP